MTGHSTIDPPTGAWPYQLKRSDGKGLYEPPVYRPKNGLLRWFEARLPVGGLVYSSVIGARSTSIGAPAATVEASGFICAISGTKAAAPPTAPTTAVAI